MLGIVSGVSLGPAQPALLPGRVLSVFIAEEAPGLLQYVCVVVECDKSAALNNLPAWRRAERFQGSTVSGAVSSLLCCLSN